MQPLLDQMHPLLEQLSKVLGSQIPPLLGAMALLVGGWIIAKVGASMARKLVHHTTLDTRLAGLFFPGEHTKAVDIQRWTGKSVFYLVMLLVVVAVLETLQLSQVNEPLNRLLTEVFQFLPRLVSALILLGVAWVLATVLRVSIQRGLEAVRFDERFQDQTEITPENPRPFSSAIGDTVYWLVLLLFLPAVLGAWAE